MEQEKGFTLIELIVTIALIAIISTIAVPSFIRQRNDGQLRSTASTLRGDMEIARYRAMRETASAAVLFRADGYSIFIDDGSGGGIPDNWVQDGDERLLCNRSFRGGIAIDMASVTFQDNRTRFTARGHIGIGGGLDVVNSAGGRTTVNMNNRFGKIAIE